MFYELYSKIRESEELALVESVKETFIYLFFYFFSFL